MKIRPLLTILIPVILISCSTDRVKDNTPVLHGANPDNNLLFDNEETHLLANNAQIKVFGEVSEELSISFSDLQMRSVVVKEVLPEGGERLFKGTYRYDGYSLEDILADVKLDKKSGFNPVTDLYVKVHGKDGTYTVVSWGEIFYPVHHHLQLIAIRSARHVPFKTPDVRYPLPSSSRLVISNDLLTCRNISDPVAIEVCSYQGDFSEVEMEDLYWPTLTLEGFGTKDIILEELPPDLPRRESDLIFYGRGRGIHDVEPFKGHYLSELLEMFSSSDCENLKTGLIIASAPDAYRSVFTYSEIMNRNDRLEAIIIDEKNFKREGRFSLIVSGDFFSDRAMKALWKLELTK